jgi:hypothetical protein
MKSCMRMAATLAAVWSVVMSPAVLAADKAPAADWQEVVKSDAQQVFIDVASLARVGDVVEASAKTNFASPMMTSRNKPYLSANNVYRLDCVQRKVALKSIRAYADPDLQGKVLQKANFYEKNLQWMDAPTDSVFAHMIDFACEQQAAPTAPAQ